MELSVNATLSGFFWFRGHTINDPIPMKEAIHRLRNDTNKPQIKGGKVIPGIDYVNPVERSSGFLFTRFLEGLKTVSRTIVDEGKPYPETKRIQVSVPTHKYLVDSVLFSSGTANERWFFVQGDDLGDAFGRLNRYLQALDCIKEVSITSFGGLPHPENVIQDILIFLYFHNHYVERISGIKIAGKRYNVMGTKVRYSGDFDLRRSEFADEINEKVRSGETIESLTLVLTRGSLPASVGMKVPNLTIRNDLRISSRGKISNKTVRTAIGLSNLLEENYTTTFTSTIEMERKLSKSLVSLENFL